MIHLKIIDKDGYTFYGSADKQEFFFGKKKTNDIVSKMRFIAQEQLRFLKQPKFWTVENLNDSDKTTVSLNGKQLCAGTVRRLSSGDVIMIFQNDDKENSLFIEVLREIKSQAVSNDKRRTIQLTSKNEFLIGRDANCDIILDNPQAERIHARIIYDGENHYIEDLKSSNGTYLNNKKIKRAMLRDNDRIEVPSAAYIYIDKKLLFSRCEHGIEVDVVEVSKDVQDRVNKHGKVRLVDDVSMRIEMGSFVGIVGGSGAGKSTLLDCINGRRPGTGGYVYYDTNDFYQNMNCYQYVVGYVPQKDILHENLSVFNSLCYTATMRIRNDITKAEIEEIVRKVIGEVKLEGKEHLKISTLSGGQKKRVSIAMELLSNPKIIFLDEPTSGLSPDLDLEIMSLLKDLSKQGRTIVIITHAMENINQCDKIAFLGRGGKLCFYDSPKNIRTYFGTKDFSKIFNMLSEEEYALRYEAKYRASEYYRRLMDVFKKTYNFTPKPKNIPTEQEV